MGNYQNCGNYDGMAQGIIEEIGESGSDNEGKFRIRIPAIHGPFTKNSSSSSTIKRIDTEFLPWASVILAPGSTAGGTLFDIGEVVYISYILNDTSNPIIIGTTGKTMEGYATSNPFTSYVYTGEVAKNNRGSVYSVDNTTYDKSTGTYSYSAGEPTTGCKSSAVWLWPSPYTTGTSRCFAYPDKNHGGQDISAAGINGTDAVASRSGVVEKIFTGCNNSNGLVSGNCQSKGICHPSTGYYNGFCNGGYGNCVIIRSDDGQSDHHFQVYMHLLPNTITVSEGQRVTQGQVIGKIGSTGMSTGPHLHFACNNSPSYSSFSNKIVNGTNTVGFYNNNRSAMNYIYPKKNKGGTD